MGEVLLLADHLRPGRNRRRAFTHRGRNSFCLVLPFPASPKPGGEKASAQGTVSPANRAPRRLGAVPSGPFHPEEAA